MRRKVIICLVAGICILSPGVEAQVRRGERQVKRVMAKEFEVIKADPKRFKEAVILMQMALGHLGYGTGPFTGEFDERTRQAVARFSTNTMKTSAAELDAEIWAEILDAYQETTKPWILLPPLRVSTASWDHYVMASGTLLIQGEELGIPLQTTEVQCHRQMGICIVATAMLNENYLSTDIETYEVERWDSYEIVTKPMDKLCVRYTLRISRNQNTVTGLRSTINQSGLCAGISTNEMPLKLEDGSKATETYDVKRRAANRKYMQVSNEFWEDRP